MKYVEIMITYGSVLGGSLKDIWVGLTIFTLSLSV